MRYELMLILKPLLPEDIKSKVIKQIEELIGTLDGKIQGTDIWGKRHLSYPVKKHEEGYYIIYKLDLEEKNIAEFSKKLQLTNGVLRHLLLKESEI